MPLSTLCCGAGQKKPTGEAIASKELKPKGGDGAEEGTSYEDESLSKVTISGKHIPTPALDVKCPVRARVQAAVATLENDENYSLNLRKAATKYVSGGYYGDAIYCLTKAFDAESETIAQADILNCVGTAYRKAGKYNQALTVYERSLKLLQSEDTSHQRPEVDCSALLESSKVTTNIGLTLKEIGLLEQALKHFEMALALQKAFYGDDAQNTDIAKSFCHIGKVQSKMNQNDNALSSYEMALSMLRKSIGKGVDNSDLASALGKLGNLYAAMVQYDRALEFHKLALAMKSRLQVEPSEIASSLMDTGNVYYVMGLFRRALRYHFRSLKLKKSYTCRDHRAVAVSLGNIGYAYEGLGKFKKAAKFFRKTLALLQDFHENPRHPEITRTECNIARVTSVLHYSGAVKECGDAILY